MPRKRPPKDPQKANGKVKVKSKGKTISTPANVRTNDRLHIEDGRNGVSMGMAARNTEKQHAKFSENKRNSKPSRLGAMNFVMSDLPYTAALQATVLPAKSDLLEGQAQGSQIVPEMNDSPALGYKPMWEMEAESAFERLQMAPAPNIVCKTSLPVTSSSSHTDLSGFPIDYEPANDVPRQDELILSYGTPHESAGEIQDDCPSSSDASSNVPEETMKARIVSDVPEPVSTDCEPANGVPEHLEPSYSGFATERKSSIIEGSAATNKIIGQRRRDGILQYLVQFEGYAVHETSWVDANDLEEVNINDATNLNSRFEDAESGTSDTISFQCPSIGGEALAKDMEEGNEFDENDVDVQELDEILDAQGDIDSEDFDEMDLQDDMLDSERLEHDFHLYDGNLLDGDGSFDGTQILYAPQMPKTTSRSQAKKAKKQIAKARSLGLAESELEYAMAHSFIRDRVKKTAAKQTHPGKRIKSICDQTNGRWTVEGMDTSTSVRQIIHQIASVFDIKSKSKGPKDHRVLTLEKVTRNSFSKISREAVDRVVAQRKFVPRLNNIVQGNAATADKSHKSDKSLNNNRLKDGDIVGKGAPEISAENRGHAMLSKMGWTQGTGLGAQRSGVQMSVEARVKTTKFGLA